MLCSLPFTCHYDIQPTGVKIYEALIAACLCGGLYGYVVYQSIHELQNWDDNSCTETSRSPLAWWYVVVSIPLLLCCLFGACLVGWQLPNRGRAMTVVAIFVDLVLGGMLAWGIALYSSRGWCDFFAFDVLLVTWGGSIPILFLFTYVWGRLREVKLARTGRAGKRRLRRANRQLAGAQQQQMMDGENAEAAGGGGGSGDMSVNFADDNTNGGVSGRATSSIMSIASNGGGGSSSTAGMSPSPIHRVRRLTNNSLAHPTTTTVHNNNNNNNTNGNHYYNNNDDISARSGFESPTASGRSARPPDSISTDRRRNPHQPYHLTAAANGAAAAAAGVSSTSGAGVRWADASDLSGRSTTAPPSSSTSASNNNNNINNSNYAANNTNNNNTGTAAGGGGGAMGTIVSQSGNDGTGSGRSRTNASSAAAASAGSSSSRHMMQYHSRLASDNLEVPQPAHASARALSHRLSADASSPGNSSPGRS